jgi:hypothetical protein
MHRNPLFLAFLVLLALGTAWYVGVTGIKLMTYYTYSEEVGVSLDNVWVENPKASSYYLQATYNFTANDQEYTGGDKLGLRIFRNKWSAEKAMNSLPQGKWLAWHKKGNPSDSLLNRIFPLKRCVSSLVLIALLGYFVWLGYYVARQQN